MIEKISALRNKATERVNYYTKIDFPNLANEFTELVNILNETVVISQTKQTVLNAIKYYCRSVFDAMNEGDLSLLQFYSL